MRAVRQHAFGGPDVLGLETLPDPHPMNGQVRIRVEAAGVHLLDTLIRQGDAGGPGGRPVLPMIPGREVAGLVDEIGPGVAPSWLDQIVVADLGLASGGYAELAVAPVDALHPVTNGLDPDHAVALIGTGRTAMAILEVAAIGPDDVVIVTAAAGGIGTVLVQAVRAAGATVIGLAGGRSKTTLVRELGASEAVDYQEPDWPDVARAALGSRRATLTLDGVGGEIGRKAMELLPPGGRLVMFGRASGSLIPLTAGDLYERGIAASAAIGSRLRSRPGGLRPLEEQALRAAGEGWLRPIVGQSFSLADAAAAHEAVEARATVGKTVLHPWSVDR